MTSIGRSIRPLLLVGLFAASGCAGFSLHPVHEWLAGNEPGRKVLKPQWHRPLVLNKERSYNPYEGGSALGDPEDALVFVGTSAGRFYALESSSGEMVWKFDSDDAVNSTPILSEDRKIVYFGNDAGKLYALETATGKQIFAYAGGAEIRSQPLLVGRALFFKDVRGKVHAVDASSGKGLWIYQREPPEGYVVESTSGIAVWGNVVLAGFYDGFAVGINLIEGTEAWRSDLSEFVPIEMEAASGKIDVNTTPVVIGDQVLFSSFRGGLYGLDPQDGTILWRRSDLKMTSGLSAAGDEIYVSLTNKGVMRLSAKAEGKTVWTSKFSGKTLSTAVPYKDIVIVTDSVFGLIVLSRGTGQVLDMFTPMWGSSAQAEVKSGRIIVHSNGGSLYSFFVL
jgi:outer membrane protein assembly factor BamB